MSRVAQEVPGRPSAFFVDHGAVAWFEGPKLRTLLGGFLTFVPGDDLVALPDGPIAALGPALFAWAARDQVFYRTPRGIAAEALPTYVLAPGTPTFPPPPPGPPFPCSATGIALPSESEVVVVGVCGDGPAHGGAPREGFIVERDRERWRRLPDRPPPLRALAGDGRTVVAVGDDGTVMWRRSGVWTREPTRREGPAFVGVALLEGRAIARTREGDLVDLARPTSPLPTFGEPRPSTTSLTKRRARAMCLTTRGPVAWFERDTFVDSGAARLLDRVAIWETDRWRVVFSGEPQGTTVEQLACDGDTIWLVTSAPQKPLAVLTLSASQPGRPATVVW